MSSNIFRASVPFLVTVMLFGIVVGLIIVFGKDNPIGQILQMLIFVLYVALPVTFGMSLISGLKNLSRANDPKIILFKKVVFLITVVISSYLFLFGDSLHLLPKNDGMGGFSGIFIFLICAPIACFLGVDLFKKK